VRWSSRRQGIAAAHPGRRLRSESKGRDRGRARARDVPGAAPPRSDLAPPRPGCSS
jgi:hypothetical protein